MDELRQSNKELLQKLRIGQARAWDILHKTPIEVASEMAIDKKESNVKRPYTFSTPTKTYLELLDKAGNERLKQVSATKHRKDNMRSPNAEEFMPLSDIMNPSFSSVSSNSSYGRPHKMKSPDLNNDDCIGGLPSPVHSPLCTENHRETLHRKLNESYSKLASDLKQIVPRIGAGADLAFDLSNNSKLYSKPDSYYDDIRRFRMANRELSVKPANDLEQSTRRTPQKKSSYVIKEDDENLEEREHQCIQTYSVGKDFRAVDSHSGTQCPLCIGADDTKHRGLIRVNIAHDDLVNYRILPQQCSDSASLSAHCSAGWEMSASHRKSYR